MILYFEEEQYQMFVRIDSFSIPKKGFCCLQISGKESASTSFFSYYSIICF